MEHHLQSSALKTENGFCETNKKLSDCLMPVHTAARTEATHLSDRLQEVLLLQLSAKMTPTRMMETPDVSLRYCIKFVLFYPTINPPSDSNWVVVLCARFNSPLITWEKRWLPLLLRYIMGESMWVSISIVLLSGVPTNSIGRNFSQTFFKNVF